MIRFLCVICATASLVSSQQTGIDRPNFVFVFVDDLGFGDLKSYGHPYAITANLDRLAAEGTSFHGFHNTGNICPTSRAGFMTSRNPSWFPNYTEEYGFMGTQTVTKIVHDAGYVVGHIGKWNIGPTPNGTSYPEYGIDDLRLVRSISGDVRGREGLRFDEAIDFVEQNRDKPFYLNLWATAPHTPIDPVDELILPFQDLQVDKNLFGYNMQNKLTRLEESGLDINDNMKRYLGVVYGLDLNVGRLMDKLDDLNIAQNTVFVFSSDNGPAESQAGSSGIFRGDKHDYYEGGVVTPFIVRWPGRVPQGKINEVSFFSALDWLPTIGSLAGAQIPWEFIEGEDISDIWLGSDRPRKNPIFFRDLQRRTTVTMCYGGWKILDWVQELYNLTEDPEERNNVYDQYPDVVTAMLGTIRMWEATLPDVHARLPDDAFPFDANVPWKTIPPPSLLVTDDKSDKSSAPTAVPAGTGNSPPADENKSYACNIPGILSQVQALFVVYMLM